MDHKQLNQLGFHVWSVGGVSRAWRRFFSDGNYVLLTDAGGYDLPEASGQFQAMLLSATDEVLGLEPCLDSFKDLASQLERWKRFNTNDLEGNSRERQE